MKHGSADLRSPDAIVRFRHRYLEFDKAAHGALDLTNGDLHSLGEWLHREQLPYWKLQLRRRHDKYKEAWREYINARHGDPRIGKTSCVDERKIYERAKRAKEEAEDKIRRIEKWVLILDSEIEKIIAPVRRFRATLDAARPKAIARLDHALDRLEEYLMPSGGTAAGRPAPAPEKEKDNASDQPRGTDADGGAE